MGTNEITKEIRKDIAKYCEEMLLLVNKDYLNKKDIYENEFLEYMYCYCEGRYFLYGYYYLTIDEIMAIIEKKMISNYVISKLDAFNNKIIVKVDKYSTLIFEDDKKIKK